ncbi:MAG TPA: pitrilysin family protein [Bryobacteraceae bacterium]|nr:pitrilysin family protein [Bryobacteraceae bacterium]
MLARYGLGLAVVASASWGQVKLPPYTREVLPNGAVVYLMTRPGVSLVGFRILVRGGQESDPPDRGGLASVTAQLLRKGSSRRTADQFSDELDFLGGTFQTDLGFGPSSATTISGEFLKKDFDRGLDLIADAVLHPAFPDAEVQKLVAQRVDAAKSIKDNPNAAINSYFQSFFFGSWHPYGHPPDEVTLARIKRQDVVDYHQRVYCGRNLVVIASGDFDPSAAEPKIRDAFGAAPAGTAFAWPAQAQLKSGGQLLLVDKPDATQTYFYIGQPGIDRKNPDRVTLQLVNTLFGGRFTSMLNDELRISSGLTYGAGCQLQQPRLPGGIVITTFTKTETTAKAVDMALDVLKRLGEKGISSEQLASAKAYVKGTYPTQRLETSDQLAVVLGELELYGLGKDEVDDLFSRIDAVTLEQANAAARKYYRAENLTFVLLGNASKIREAAARYAPQVREVSINQAGWSAMQN